MSQPREYSYNYTDIAKITGLAESTVKRRCSNAAGRWAWSYQDLEVLTDADNRVVRQHKRREYFWPGNLESVIVYACRYARTTLKRELLRMALGTTDRVKTYDPDSFESVVVFCTSNARPEIKERIVSFGTNVALGELPGQQKRPRRS